MIRDLALDNFFGFGASRPAAGSKILGRLKPVARQHSAAKTAVWQVWATAVLAVICLLLLGSYLVSVNSYATTGYQIKKMQNQLSALAETNQKLTIKVAQVSSMVAVQSQVLGADFVPAGTPQFLQVNQMSMR